MTYAYEDSDLAFRKLETVDLELTREWLKTRRISMANELRNAANVVEGLEPEEAWPVIKDILQTCALIRDWHTQTLEMELDTQRMNLKDGP